MMRAFARAAAKREGARRLGLVEAIVHERPELAGKNPRPIGLGKEAHTVFIGGEFFKGPLDFIYDEKLGKLIYDMERVVAAFDKEIEHLQQLQGKGLPIPEVTWVGEECVAYGMTPVPGAPLGDFERMYSRTEQRLLAEDIIGFVVDMGNALPLQEDGAFITHDDLHCNNIFANIATRRLSGVIDFGMVKYCTQEEWFPRGGHGRVFHEMLMTEFNERKSDIKGAPVNENNSLTSLHKLAPKTP